MRLEAEIKQKTPFRSAHQRATVNLIYTHNWLMARQKAFFKPFDITIQQYNVLRILRGQSPNPISTSDIRERMLDKMSDVSRIVDRLVKKDLVLRQTCKADKRLVDVLISEEGLKLLEAIDTRNTEMDDTLSGLTDKEADLLSDLLDKVRSHQDAS